MKALPFLITLLLITACPATGPVRPDTQTDSNRALKPSGNQNGTGSPDLTAEPPVPTLSSADGVTTIQNSPAPAAPPACATVENTVVHFDTDSDELDETARKTLAAYADCARSAGAGVIRISGHADRRGSDAYNFQLSARRSAAVARYLKNLSPDLTLQESECGERYPIPGSLAENRRAVIFPEQGGDPCLVRAQPASVN